MKLCPTCQEEKDPSEFSKNRGNTDGLHNYCKPCHRDRQRNWYKANRAKVKLNRLQQYYGLSEEEYETLVAQFPICPICAQDFGSRGPVVDHDHTTGAVRGLLCHPCNLLLGHAKDDPTTLIAAADYLAKHS